LWRHAQCYASDASPGYGHLEDETGAGCGGTITLLAPKWTHAVTASGSILENRVQWLILSGLPGGDLGIANIYAHNTSPERCTLWETMARDLPTHCRWLLLGDFNMVEARCDKNRPNASMIPRRERELFDALKCTLHVEDPPRTAGSLRYSWENGRDAEVRSLARLDRLYVFPSVPTARGRTLVRYEIRGDMSRSDHHPVLVSLQLAARPPQPRHWKMNAKWLEEVSPKIRDLWVAAPGRPSRLPIGASPIHTRGRSACSQHSGSTQCGGDPRNPSPRRRDPANFNSVR
ncbi:hypothetical protein KC19_N025700, partial [Ceratodon purpureus]